MSATEVARSYESGLPLAVRIARQIVTILPMAWSTNRPTAFSISTACGGRAAEIARAISAERMAAVLRLSRTALRREPSAATGAAVVPR